MKRKIIEINEEKCNGCGACAEACHEGAIAMINGKAKLVRDDYCDGLGDCLPACPVDAISFVEREALPYDEEAVKKHQMNLQGQPLPCGCPGTESRELNKKEETSCNCSSEVPSMLTHWPVQIKLAPINAPYFKGANLLIAADCTAFAYGNFHEKFIKNHVTLVGCPKLDSGDYSEKLTEIIANNDIKSVKVVRMTVPCCGGMEQAVKKALINSGKFIPWQVIVISPEGQIVE